MRQCEGDEPYAAKKCAVANGGQAIRECQGGEAAATTERIISDASYAVRQCDGGESRAVFEHTFADGVHPWRHDNGVEIPFVPAMPDNSSTLNFQVARDSLGSTLRHTHTSALKDSCKMVRMDDTFGGDATA